MNLTLIAAFASLLLFLSMLLFFEVGRRLGIARLARDPKGLAKGTGAAEGAIFAILGLIIAFTFSGAATRFEDRKHLITQEANAIGTAYLRLDLLSNARSNEIRALFRDYTELRSNLSLNVADASLAKARNDAVAKLQSTIWDKSIGAVHEEGASVDASKLLLPALNEMIDITTTRAMAAKNHPPAIVYILLAGLSVVSAMLIGYSMSGNKLSSRLHSVLFALIISLSCYVIIDLEFPRLGLIRVDSSDQVLVDLRKSMDQANMH